MEEQEERDDDWISSGADYSQKAEFKTALLAMELVKKCNEARATEMKQGFWNNKIDKQGNAVRIWVEDQRKVYINTVIALDNFLHSECLNDKAYQSFVIGDDKESGINKELNELKEKYAYTIFEFDNRSNGLMKTNKKFIPQIDEELLVPSPYDPKVLINIRGGWDFKVNAYYDELVPLYDKLFRELRNVIYRLKDFKKKTVIG